LISSCGLPQDEFLGPPVKEESYFEGIDKTVGFRHSIDQEQIGVDFQGYEVYYKILSRDVATEEYIENEIELYEEQPSINSLITTGRYKKLLYAPLLSEADLIPQDRDDDDYETRINNTGWASQNTRFFIDFSSFDQSISSKSVFLEIKDLGGAVLDSYETFRWTSFTSSLLQDVGISNTLLESGKIKLFEDNEFFLYQGEDKSILADDILKSSHFNNIEPSSISNLTFLFFANTLGRSEATWAPVRSEAVYIGKLELLYTYID